ncbi:MAG: hypothetical protein WDZ29_05480 [Balneolaceae bacterium]
MNRSGILFSLLAIIIVVALAVFFMPSENNHFLNPYEQINWQTVHYYDANLHTHTTLSDGSYDPHQAIDMYHDLEYHILALTDHDIHHHDARPQSLYPWTRLNDIYFEIRDQLNPIYDRTFESRANEVWQNRDPEELGMLSVEGSELSASHHIGSYMSEYAGASRDEHESMSEVGERDGLAMFFHPGRYERDVDWYIDFYRTYPHVIGQEIYNQADRYPMDRDKWDQVLHQLMPDRPVWGFANDDTHGTTHFGLNRNVFLISDLNIENVRHAMAEGHLFLYVPVERGGRPDIRIRNVQTSGSQIELTLEGDYNEIQWITHDPEFGESRVVHTGTDVDVSEVPLTATFVRAVIVTDGGRTYTQPFGIVRVER